MTADVQRRFADLAAATREEREQTVRSSGSDWLELSTDSDWLSEIAAHVRRRTAASGDGASMSWDFLAPERLWLLLVVAALVVAYVVAQRRRAVNTVRFTQIEMLEQIAPRRPGWRRHSVAGRAAGRTDRRGVRGRAAGRAIDDASEVGGTDHLAVRRVAVDAGRRRRHRADWTPRSRPARTSSTPSIANIDVGLISFSGRRDHRGGADHRSSAS